MQYWFPDLPAWIPGVIAMVILGAANLISVKSFGEFEFWFAMIKIVTILLMIIAGFGLIFFGIGNGGEAIGISNLVKWWFLYRWFFGILLCIITCSWSVSRSGINRYYCW